MQEKKAERGTASRINIAKSSYLHLKYNPLTLWILYRICRIVNEGTAPTVTVCIEGRPGIGKTTYGTVCMLGSIVLLSYLIYRGKKSIPIGRTSIRIPHMRDLEHVYPEVADAVRELIRERKCDTAVRYVSRFVVFTPFELLKLHEDILRRDYPSPFIMLDDAGSFFCRSGWVGFPREWKQAISLIVSNLPMIRTLTGSFIITTPTIRSVFSGIVRFIERSIMMVPLSRKVLEFYGNDKILLDRGAYYYVKQYRSVAGMRAEVFERLTKDPKPIAFPDVEHVKPILDKVWRIRKEWMRYVEEKAKTLLTTSEKGSTIQLSQLFTSDEPIREEEESGPDGSDLESR